MKKVIAVFIILLCVICISSTVFAVGENILDKEAESKLVEIKDKELETLEDYRDAYGSDTYGFTAYILHKVQVYSIPLGFIAIAIGAIYQYVIGIRKLDVRDKGFGLIIASVTVLVICQVLPLVFAIVVKGWRG